MKIEINGKTYEASEIISEKKEEKGVIKICILPSGNVLVGYFNQKWSSCWLENAAVIRRWGTERGLGQISEEGPTSETILDHCHGRVDFDVSTLIFSIEVTAVMEWQSALLNS